MKQIYFPKAKNKKPQEESQPIPPGAENYLQPGACSRKPDGEPRLGGLLHDPEKGRGLL